MWNLTTYIMRREPKDVRSLKECFDPPSEASRSRDDPVDPPATDLGQDAMKTFLSARGLKGEISGR